MSKLSPYDRGQMTARQPGSFSCPSHGAAQREFLRGLEEGRLEQAHAAMRAAQRRA